MDPLEPLEVDNDPFMNIFDDEDVAVVESPAVLAESMAKTELHSYLHGSHHAVIPMNTNIIKWWEDNKNQFPVLYRMHLDFIAIQGISN